MSEALAYIAVITDLKHIQGADKIELAIVNDGWQVIVQKRLHKIGDKVIYIEPDRTFLPCEPDFEFLRKNCYRVLPSGKDGFRLRTIRMRGELSQGLIVPLASLEARGYYGGFPVGHDVTAMLEIAKYEKPLPANMAGRVKGNWPYFIPKTDEERIQNVQFHHLNKQRTYNVTEKLDGTSFTCFKTADEFGVCSRNYQLEEDESNLYWQVAWNNDLPNKCPENYAIQGEIVGPSIQKNRYGIVRPTLFTFGMFDITNRQYMPFEHLRQWCDRNNIRTVPLIDTVKLSITDREQKTALLLGAEGDSVITPQVEDGESLGIPEKKVTREGLVYKSYEDGQLGSFSFKVISNSFLMEAEQDE